MTFVLVTAPKRTKPSVAADSLPSATEGFTIYTVLSLQFFQQIVYCLTALSHDSYQDIIFFLLRLSRHAASPLSLIAPLGSRLLYRSGFYLQQALLLAPSLCQYRLTLRLCGLTLCLLDLHLRNPFFARGIQLCQSFDLLIHHKDEIVDIWIGLAGFLRNRPLCLHVYRCFS